MTGGKQRIGVATTVVRNRTAQSVEGVRTAAPQNGGPAQIDEAKSRPRKTDAARTKMKVVRFSG